MSGPAPTYRPMLTLEEVTAVERLLAVEALDNDIAVPFHRRFARTDLDRRRQLDDLLGPGAPTPGAA
jgi:hypothetical protein